jgi:hypothetical protein
VMGIAALHPSCVNCFARAQAQSRNTGRDKSTRRANHPKPVHPLAQKYFA